MIYYALDIAKYIINKCNEVNTPITNLKLQKLLYYAQGKCLAQKGSPLFGEDIYAWKYGPVIPNVYSHFSMYAANVIINNYELMEPDKSIQELIYQVLYEKLGVPAWELVEMTHEEPPWKYANKVFGIGALISKESIKQYFENENYN